MGTCTTTTCYTTHTQYSLAILTPVNVFILDDLPCSTTTCTIWLTRRFIPVEEEERCPTMVHQPEAILQRFLSNAQLNVEGRNASTQTKILLNVQHRDVGRALKH